VTVFTLDISELSHTYLGLIGDGDEYAAVELVSSLLDVGVLPQRIMIDLIGRAQNRVGELWAANEWSIAREHAATAISERALAAVAARTDVPPRRVVRDQLLDYPQASSLLAAGLGRLNGA
jgi:methanogenic corrinoid protein MtbC1